MTPKIMTTACNPVTHAQNGGPSNQSIFSIALEAIYLKVLDIDYRSHVIKFEAKTSISKFKGMYMFFLKKTFVLSHNLNSTLKIRL